MAGKYVKPQPQPVIPEPASLLEPEFEPHYKAWKAAPGPKTMGPLLNAVQPVLQSAIRTNAGRTASPTIQSKAKLLAAEAINSYDPNRAKLRTHLMSHLRGLRRLSVQEGQIIGIPERVAIDLYRVREAENELRDKLGRDPSTSELADHAGISMKRIAHIRKAQPGMAEGHIRPTGDVGEEQAPVGPAVQSTSGEEAWQHFVYADLPAVDQFIMEHTLGLHGRPVLSKQQIAAKLRLSPGAVSQRAARIQEKLDRREELGGAFFGA